MTRLERADGVLPLSLIVLARNEEAVIGRCLDSVPFAAEKIVIDSGSTDGTAAAAAAHGATVIDREWLGFGPMRQRAEEDAAHEWILMLDADEWMSDELQRQCRDELPRLLERTDALQLSRRTRYCGRTMNHYRPFARDHIWRCYRKGRAAWTSDQVHERLRPAPGCRTHRLTAPLVHDSYASVAHHQEKACRYIDLWARQAFERGRKPRLLGTFLSLPAYLVRDLVLRRGVLDGWPGVIAAWITVHSTVMKRLRLYELYRDAGRAAGSVMTRLAGRSRRRRHVQLAGRPRRLPPRPPAADRGPLEIIVADDGSGPDTRAVVERHQAAGPCPLHHVWHPDEGFRLGGIRNKAMARAVGDYIVSLDGDMVCHPRCVEDHGRLRDPGCFCQGSRIPLGPRASALMTARPGWWPSAFSPGVRRRARLARLPVASARLLNRPHRDPMTVRGCHQGFWRRDLLAVNGFNEAMWGWGREDNELAVRLGNHGRLRRNLRGVALACHLHHCEGDRGRVGENERILRETLDAGRVRCERGLDRWTADPEAWDYRAQHPGR